MQLWGQSYRVSASARGGGGGKRAQGACACAWGVHACPWASSWLGCPRLTDACLIDPVRLGSYWGNESINLTGIVGMTNNMINPLRLFQERRTRQNCPELNHDPINVGLTRWSRNFPDKGADTHSSLNGTLKSSLEILRTLLGVDRWKTAHNPRCTDRQRRHSGTYGNAYARANLDLASAGFTFTPSGDANQGPICTASSYLQTCYGPGGYIRDIWAAADYRKAIGELINGDWIDEDTLSVVARMQTFNPQTGCFIFTDIIFEVNVFGTVRPEHRTRTACEHTLELRGGDVMWTTFALPTYYSVVYWMGGAYAVLLVLRHVEVLHEMWLRLRKEGYFDIIATFDPLAADILDPVSGARSGSALLRFLAVRSSDPEGMERSVRIAYWVSDICQLVLFVGAGASYFAHQNTVRNLMKAKGTFDNQKFVDLSPMADSEMLLRAFLSFALYCALVRSVSFMILRMEIRGRLTALKSTAPLMTALFVMLVHLMFAFLIIGSLLFGSFSEYYAKILSPSSFSSILEIIIGDATVIALLLSELSTQDIGVHVSGIVFFLALVIIFFFFGTAVIVAIEGEAWSDATVHLQWRRARRVERRKTLTRIAKALKDQKSTIAEFSRRSDYELMKLIEDLEEYQLLEEEESQHEADQLDPALLKKGRREWSLTRPRLRKLSSVCRLRLLARAGKKKATRFAPINLETEEISEPVEEDNTTLVEWLEELSRCSDSDDEDHRFRTFISKIDNFLNGFIRSVSFSGASRSVTPQAPAKSVAEAFRQLQLGAAMDVEVLDEKLNASKS